MKNPRGMCHGNIGLQNKSVRYSAMMSVAGLLSDPLRRCMSYVYINVMRGSACEDIVRNREGEEC